MHSFSRRQFLKAAGVGGFLASVGGVSWLLRGQEGPVKWGLMPPLTGPFATLGEKQMQGAILAIEELNEAGGLLGRPIEYIVEDTTLKADVAVQKAQKLIQQDGVSFITGTISSSSALAVRPVINEAQVFFNPTVGANSVTTGSAECSPFLFRSELMTWQAAGALARVTIQLVEQGELAGNKYWLHIPDYAYGQSMRDTWRTITAGQLVEVGYSADPGFGGTEHGAFITQIMNSDADFLVTPLLGSPLITFMQQAADFGLLDQMPVVAPLLHFNVREIGDIALGHYTTIRYTLLNDSPENRAFIAAFQARWDDLPENFSHNAYVAVKMMALATERAGSLEDKEAIIAEAEGLHFKAPMGLSYFRSQDHQIVRDIGAGRMVKDPRFEFPVEQQLGDMVDGEDAIAGAELLCNLGV